MSIPLHHLSKTWKKEEHSRTKRNLRQFEVSAAQGCKKITDFFEILNKLEIVMKENKDLKKRLLSMSKTNANSNKKELEISNVLKVLLESAMKNAGRKTGGERYDDVMHELGQTFYHMDGLQNYKILCQNLPTPAVSTVRRKI